MAAAGVACACVCASSRASRRVTNQKATEPTAKPIADARKTGESPKAWTAAPPTTKPSGPAIWAHVITAVSTFGRNAAGAPLC